jgi:hypothetical protein
MGSLATCVHRIVDLSNSWGGLIGLAFHVGIFCRTFLRSETTGSDVMCDRFHLGTLDFEDLDEGKGGNDRAVLLSPSRAINQGRCGHLVSGADTRQDVARFRSRRTGESLHQSHGIYQT